MGEYSAVSGIKVLDRAVAIMQAATTTPSTLGDLCEVTGLPRATAHRLATALEAHHILSRTTDGKWTGGPGLPGNSDHLLRVAEPILEELVRTTGESVQLYQLAGNVRMCIAAREPHEGLHNVVPVGSKLTLSSGSAAHIFAAFTNVIAEDAIFSIETLDRARKTMISESIEEREAGLASVSTPVFDPEGHLIAVLSVSGSAERFRPSPTDKFGQKLIDASQKLTAEL
ncbi:MAG: IclR family transcriptional regulator [Corynebacterium sp.]|nr:IclR family transcriptional regulator [Corynebacterium sp.]